MLIMAQPAWILAQKARRAGGGDAGAWAGWAIYLVLWPLLVVLERLVLSPPVRHLIRQPPWGGEGGGPGPGRRAGAGGGGGGGEQQPGALGSTTERLVAYYASMLLVVALFVVCQYDGGAWVTLVDLTSAGRTAAALEGLSWLLLLPAPALIQVQVLPLITPSCVTAPQARGLLDHEFVRI